MSDQPQPSQPPVFLGWGNDLAKGVAAHLTEVANADGPVLDMGSHLVIVPAPMAGRLIEEALVAIRPQGLLTPRFTTPSNFLNQLDSGAGATEADALLTWIEILGKIDRAEYPTLFPINSGVELSQDEIVQLAWTLMDVRDTLGETPAGHNMSSASMVVEHESERWKELARLEALYLDALKLRRLGDHNQRRRNAATAPKPPANITHIWLACVAEPQPIVISALGHLAAQGIAVQAIVGGGDDKGAFDPWGRPTAEYWQSAKPDWSDFHQRVHAVGNAAAGIALVGKLLQGHEPGEPGVDKPGKEGAELQVGTVAICACDREADSARLAALIGSLKGKAVDPLGRTHASSGLHHALRAWSAFLRDDEPSFDELRAALRTPEIIKGLAGGHAETAYGSINEQLDDLDAQMQGGDLSHLLGRGKIRPELRKALETLRKKRMEQLDMPPREALKACLGDMTGRTPLRTDVEAEAYLLDVLDDLDEAADALQPADAKTMSHGDFFRLALDLTGSNRFRWSDGAESINLPGWIEAPWDPVPYMIVFGLNDHVVPRSRNADPFLPQSVRSKLGLPTNEDAFAAAAFSLEQIRRRRKGSDTRYDIIVPSADDAGDPLRPSRLLFLGETSELPARVKRLFGASSATEDAPYWEIPEGHKLDPSLPKGAEHWPIEHLSASSIATYLGSPTAFWLQKGLGLSKSTYGAVELDGSRFGILIHLALQCWAEKYKQLPPVKALGFDKKPASPKQLEAALAAVAGRVADELTAELRKAVVELHGETPGGIVLVQEQMAEARLARFASDQVHFWHEGWAIWETEFVFDNLGLKAAGVPLHGRIDRIDRKFDGNKAVAAWRLLDYKTGNEAGDPESMHIEGAGKSADFLTPDGKGRWTGVQLPLYIKAWEAKSAAAKETTVEMSAGFIDLGQAVGDTPGATLAIWDDLSPEQIKSAWDVIEEVAKRIRGKDTTHWKSDREAEYPLLPGLAAQPLSKWMNTDRLGEVRA